MSAYLESASTIWLGTLLVYTGSLKLSSFQFANRAVRNYGVLPRGVDVFVGRSLPWVELTLGAGLLIGLHPRLLALATLSLALCFLVGAVSIVLTGRRVTCGCAGRAGSDVGFHTVARAALMACAAVAAAWAPSKPVGGWIVASALMVISAAPSAAIYVARVRTNRVEAA
jgi:hypothetical protein